MKYLFVILIGATALTTSCKKKLDFGKSHFEVNEFLTSKNLKAKCGEIADIEGKEIVIVGKLNPDSREQLVGYSPQFPDTWDFGISVIDKKLKEGKETKNWRTIDKHTLGVLIYNDGVNVSSFEPFRTDLENLVKTKEDYATVQVRGIVRGYDRPANWGCTKGYYLEINEMSDVTFE